MEGPDKKLQEMLSKKFDGAEMDVDPAIWEGISTSIVTGTAPTSGGELGTGAAGKGFFDISFGWVALVGLIVGVGALVLWSAEPENVGTEQVTETAIQERPADVTSEVTGPGDVEEESESNLREPTGEALETVRADEVQPHQKGKSPLSPIAQSEPTVGPMVTTGSSSEATVGEQEEEIINEPVVEPRAEDAVDESVEESKTQETGLMEDLIPEESSQPFEEGHGIVRPMANVFSPNGDGLNDFYLPELNDAEQVSIKVIQMATGEIVFSAERLESWFGRGMDGQDLPAGSYLYVIEMTDSKGVSDQASTIVRLFR